MSVTLADNAGFCFGVNKAVDLVYEQIKLNNERDKHNRLKIYTYGSIINNSEVVSDLKKKGVDIIESEDEIKDIGGAVLIIRSHGASRSVYETANKAGVMLVDATCPFVTRIHKTVFKESRAGAHIVIIGDRDHPEVKGIIGWAEGDVSVVKDEEEAKAFLSDKKCKLCIVSQTTFNLIKFQSVVEILKGKAYDVRVINTICNATALRQEEARLLSARSDVMIVIGDKKSSNSKKLYDICREYCNDTYFIQTLDDLDLTKLKTRISVGITAGASTPDNIIQEVFLACQKKTKALTN